MSFYFATCDRSNAKMFFMEIYNKDNPGEPISLETDRFDGLLDYIGRDIIRVTDPSFHTPQIIEGKNYDKKYRPLITDALEKSGIAFGVMGGIDNGH